MVLLLVYSAALCAMDWPAQNAIMARNFGFNEQGRPVLGTVFEGEGQALAAGSGEIIFSRSADNRACRLPSPLGAWTAVDHGDGLISIYSRHEHTGGERQTVQVEQGEEIAASGISGWSRAKGFYFVLYDRRERRWVNPSMVINPLPDTRPPQILGVEVRDAQGTLMNANQLRNLKQGRYAISVNAIDTRLNPRESPIAPHRIICSVNGTEIGSLQFETISARDGVLMVYRNGLVPAKQVYSRFPAFEAGEVHLNQGQVLLELIVQDLTGNSHSVLSRMAVE